MRHLKTVRKLRGETPTGLRRRLRMAETANEELEAENTELRNDNWTLRRKLNQRSYRPLEVPRDFSDMLIRYYCDALARGMANRVISENSDVIDMYTREAAHILAEMFTSPVHYHVDPSTEISYMVEEMNDRHGSLRLSLRLRDVDLCYQEDARMMQMRRPSPGGYGPDEHMLKPPAPVEVNSRDVVFSR